MYVQPERKGGGVSTNLRPDPSEKERGMVEDEREVTCPECRGDGCIDCEYTGTVVIGGEES